LGTATWPNALLMEGGCVAAPATEATAARIANFTRLLFISRLTNRENFYAGMLHVPEPNSCVRKYSAGFYKGKQFFVLANRYG
jgi:hypothetical protein